MENRWAATELCINNHQEMLSDQKTGRAKKSTMIYSSGSKTTCAHIRTYVYPSHVQHLHRNVKVFHMRLQSLRSGPICWIKPSLPLCPLDPQPDTCGNKASIWKRSFENLACPKIQENLKRVQDKRQYDNWIQLVCRQFASLLVLNAISCSHRLHMLHFLHNCCTH